MRKKIITYTLCVLGIGISTFANSQNPALIEGYKLLVNHSKKRVIEAKVNPKQKNIIKDEESNNNKVTSNDFFKSPTDTLFYESFNGKTLDNEWVENSGTDNMIGVNDSVYGKVLKISCEQPNGNTFIEYDLTKIARGKMLSLKGDIKLENVKKGEQFFEIGQLQIKFQVGGNWIYESVQNLKGSSEWNTYSAQQDGNSNIDNTDKGSYVFKIPENAENVILQLGLQNCTGTIYFKNIRVIEYK